MGDSSSVVDLLVAGSYVRAEGNSHGSVGHTNAGAPRETDVEPSVATTLSSLYRSTLGSSRRIERQHQHPRSPCHGDILQGEAFGEAFAEALNDLTAGRTEPRRLDPCASSHSISSNLASPSRGAGDPVADTTFFPSSPSAAQASSETRVHTGRHPRPSTEETRVHTGRRPRASMDDWGGGLDVVLRGNRGMSSKQMSYAPQAGDPHCSRAYKPQRAGLDSMGWTPV